MCVCVYLHTWIASAACPARATIAMELLGHQERWRLDGESLRTIRGGSSTSAVDTTTDGVHGSAFSAVETRLGRARIQYHVTVSAAKPFGARARVLIRSRTLARPSVQAWFVGAAVVQICRRKKNEITISPLRERQRNGWNASRDFSYSFY